MVFGVMMLMMMMMMMMMILTMLLVLRLPLGHLQCRPVCRVDVALFVEG